MSTGNSKTDLLSPPNSQKTKRPSKFKKQKGVKNGNNSISNRIYSTSLNDNTGSGRERKETGRYNDRVHECIVLCIFSNSIYILKVVVMRVINQRRDRSINIDRYDISVDDNHVYAIGSGGRTVLLGDYEDSEKARGAFDSLMKAYDTKFVTTYQMPTQ
nr:MAG TPA: hypothetical protein [Caudoviricetes sp.]